MYATVIKSRPPETDGELDLCIGDKVVILNNENDGWMKGMIDENVGIFPSNCVRMLKHLFSVKVQYRYESQLSDELDLMVGDVVSVLDDKLEDDGWWFGELNGRVGVFPNNFVETMKPIEVVPPLANKPVIRKKTSSSTKSQMVRPNLSKLSCESRQEKFGEEKDVVQTKTEKSNEDVIKKEEEATNVEDGGGLLGELKKVRFDFEWFSMRHAKVLSQLVDEVEVEKKERKAIEQDLASLRMMAERLTHVQSV